MTIELGAHVSASGGVDLALVRANDFGMTACQLFTKSERQWAAKPLDPAVVERFHANQEQFRLKHLVAHDSYLINVASPNPEMWEKSRSALAHELERCDTLGIHYLVSHPGAHMGEGPEAGIARVAEAINRIHDEMPDGKAKILIETTAGQGTALGRSFEEIAGMIAGVDAKDRIGVCLDTCHIFAAGYDIRDAESYSATIQAFEDIVGLSNLKCLHLNDSKKGLGLHVDRHAHIGEGEIGLAGFACLMNDKRLCGLPGILETPKEAPDFEEDRMNLNALKALIAA
ncbi:MAG TPA: deoxyribonuclease IV [Thermomicrobiales bacterium]|jgi:deoxyribonuclease-4|nr:deoxyribonuclease IV [Thermomicrobiales bacterium]